MTQKPTKATRSHVVSEYRKRSRMWVMEAMPTMSAAEWKEYTEWVAAFGSPYATRGRRVKRQLTAARDTGVTVTVMTAKTAQQMQRIIRRCSSPARKAGPV